MRSLLVLLLTLSALCGHAFAFALTSAQNPSWTPHAPRLLELRPQASAKEILDAFVGIPYRADGAVDVQGNFVLFADPAVRFDTPGLNCSGFVGAAWRMLLREPLRLEQAKTDRLGDSAKGAAMGEDWDFGWDFVLNLTQGHAPTLLTPQAAQRLDAAALQGQDGRTLRGFDLTDARAWREALARMEPGSIVLVDFSKPWNKKGYTLLHHHVALILPLENGERWYYHAVGKRGVERIALHTEAGLARLLKMYPASALGARKVLLLAVPLPG